MASVLKVDTLKTTDESVTVNLARFGQAQVIEYVSSICDGSVVATSAGNVQFQSVTGIQPAVYTQTLVNGSEINYTPPPDTTQVIYKFNFASYAPDEHSIGSFKFFIDDVEVIYARTEVGGRWVNIRTPFEWVINIGGSSNANTGRQDSWTSTKNLKMTYRSYGTSNDRQLHGLRWWEGADSPQFSMPILTLIAIR